MAMNCIRHAAFLGCFCLSANLPIAIAQDTALIQSTMSEFVDGKIDQASVKTAIDDLLLKAANTKEKGDLLLRVLSSLSKDIPGTSQMVLAYASEAASLPLSPKDLSQVNIYLGNAFEADAHKAAGKAESRELKLKALAAYLQAFKVISSKLSAKERSPLPSVSKFDYDGPTTDPQYIALEQQHAAEVARRLAVETQNSLITQGEVVDSRIRELSRETKLTPEEREKITGQGGFTESQLDALSKLLSQ